MFDSIDEKVKISTQKKVNGKIIKKKGGRPKNPEKKKYHLKIPILLHNQMKKEASRRGVNMSSFVCDAIIEKLSRS